MVDTITLANIRPADLPAPPEQALRLVHACTKPNVSSLQLAELVSHEPILTAEILRISNSSYFGFRKGINSVARAITILGNRALRNLALCVAMKDAMRVESIPGLDIGQFWEESLRRAVSARLLCKYKKQDPEAAFTAGLLADFGLFVMVYLQKEKVAEWNALAAMNPAQRLEGEQQLFGTTHDVVGKLVAEAWNLPEDLKYAIGNHHTECSKGGDKENQGLCDIVHCADWIASLFSATDKRLVLQHIRKLLEGMFGIPAKGADEILETVSMGVADAAVAMGIRVGEQPSFENILREANARLIEENISYQELTWKLEKALQERDRYADELQRELTLAREVQKSLLPPENPAVKGLIGINISAKAVSGDFYDFFILPDGRYYFCIADVSGKGMNAALLMAKTASLFHCLGKVILDPGELVARINREIMETSVRGMFVTLIAGIYDPHKDSLFVTNAGHLPILLVDQEGATKEFPANGSPVGILEESEFPNLEIQLNGGTAYLYTDGLIEAKKNDGSRMEMTGLLALIEKHKNLTAYQCMKEMVSHVQAGSDQLDDDLTLLILSKKACVEYV